MVQSIGANIKAKRRALGLKQEDLADKLGLTQANVSRIEASLKGPSGEMLLAVAGALGCDVRDLLGVEETKHPARELDKDVKAFVLNVMERDPQFRISLRNFVNNFDDLPDEDWKFLATQLKLALSYVTDVIEAKQRG
jgi:transcriptional regulator with XRE-family HTH domain